MQEFGKDVEQSFESDVNQGQPVDKQRFLAEENIEQVQARYAQKYAVSLTARQEPKKWFPSLFRRIHDIRRSDDSLRVQFEQRLFRLELATKQSPMLLGPDGPRNEAIVKGMVDYFNSIDRSALTYAHLNSIELVLVDHLSAEELAAEGIYLRDRLLRMGYTEKTIDSYISTIESAKDPITEVR